MDRCKILAIGDDAAKKVQLLTTFIEGKYPKEYIPAVFDNSTKTIKVDEKKVVLDLWDSTGFDNLPAMRQTLYINANIILLCYSIKSKKSFRDILNKWYPEMMQLCPKTPFLLVATESEKREKYGGIKDVLVSTKAGFELSKQIKAVEYIECSAKEKENVEYIFERCVKTAYPSLRSKSIFTSSKKEKEINEERSTYIICYIIFFVLYAISLLTISQ